VQRQTPRGEINMAECTAEDLDDRGYPRPFVARSPTELERSERPSLMLRIRHRDPRRACYKDHNSVVLRAESMAQKFEWLRRLVAPEGDGSQHGTAPGQPGQQQQGQTAAQQQAAAAAQLRGGGGGPTQQDLLADSDDESSVGRSGPSGANAAAGGAAGAADGGEYDYQGAITTMQKDPAIAELDCGLGEGAGIFRADALRDAQGRLLPAPVAILSPDAPSNGGKKGLAAVFSTVEARARSLGPAALPPFFASAPLTTKTAAALPQPSASSLFLSSLKPYPIPLSPCLARCHTTVQDTYESRYEALMEQFGRDMGVYVRAVCETVVITARCFWGVFWRPAARAASLPPARRPSRPLLLRRRCRQP